MKIVKTLRLINDKIMNILEKLKTIDFNVNFNEFIRMCNVIAIFDDLYKVVQYFQFKIVRA